MKASQKNTIRSIIRHLAITASLVVCAGTSASLARADGPVPRWDPWANSGKPSCNCPSCKPSTGMSSAYFKDVINPNNGEVIRFSYVNGKLRSRKRVGRAVLTYNSAGRPFYTFNGQTVVANKPAMGGGTTGDPGVDLAIGIIKLIEAATK
jgi:hypothetical protein